MTKSAISKYLAEIGRKGGKKGGLTRARKLSKRKRTEIARKGGLAKATRYVGLGTVPKTIPAGRVLVHNSVQHAVDTPCGLNGFRAWTQALTRKLESCRCGWSGLPHYKVRRPASDRQRRKSGKQ